MTGSFPGLSLHMHIHAHAVGKGSLLALFLCRKKNGGCTFLPKDASRVTDHVGWTRAGTFWVSVMREELVVLPRPRRATLRPPGAEEISRAVSAHERPTAWSLSGCGLGGGICVAGVQCTVAVFRAAGGFQDAPPASRALTRRGVNIRECVEDLKDP